MPKLPDDNLIPDFVELEEMTQEASRAKAVATALEHELEQLEAKYIKQALDDKQYWPKNKPPSMSYCNSVVVEVGNTPEQAEHLLRLRKEIAENLEKFHTLKDLIQIKRDKLDLYRTKSANERKLHL